MPPGTCSLRSWTSPSSIGRSATHPSSPCHTSTEKGKDSGGREGDTLTRRGVRCVGEGSVPLHRGGGVNPCPRTAGDKSVSCQVAALVGHPLGHLGGFLEHQKRTHRRSDSVGVNSVDGLPRKPCPTCDWWTACSFMQPRIATDGSSVQKCKLP